MSPGVSTASPVVRVSPGPAPARWEVVVPGSKSLTNRALLLAGVAGGRSRLRRPLRADDTLVMADALRALGAEVSDDGADWLVDGLGSAPGGGGDTAVEIWCGMAGTAGRFLVPMLAAGRGRFIVDAHEQLRRRPLGPVLASLRAQGATIDGEAFPLTVTAAGLRGGTVEVDTSISSQFLSGLLMAAPFARQPTALRFGALVSRPYVRLTLDVMRAFGVDVRSDGGELRVAPQAYRAAEYAVEPDASTASYFLACAALTGTAVTIPWLSLDETGQGDVELVEHLVAMGAEVVSRDPLTLAGPPSLRGVTVDMGDSSDVFMTLACVAPFAEGPTTITGIGHARVKESDRVSGTASNLRALGLRVDERADSLTIHPGTPLSDVRLPTYDDHRIAMAFSLIGTRVPVVLEDPAVVAKTCPEYFTLLGAAGVEVARC
jgi:3-phosphoshikimate 1-carboxyvinyltransferase